MANSSTICTKLSQCSRLTQVKARRGCRASLKDDHLCEAPIKTSPILRIFEPCQWLATLKDVQCNALDCPVLSACSAAFFLKYRKQADEFLLMGLWSPRRVSKGYCRSAIMDGEPAGLAKDLGESAAGPARRDLAIVYCEGRRPACLGAVCPLLGGRGGNPASASPASNGSCHHT